MLRNYWLPIKSLIVASSWSHLYLLCSTYGFFHCNNGLHERASKLRYTYIASLVIIPLEFSELCLACRHRWLKRPYLSTAYLHSISKTIHPHTPFYPLTFVTEQPVFDQSLMNPPTHAAIQPDIYATTYAYKNKGEDTLSSRHVSSCDITRAVVMLQAI